MFDSFIFIPSAGKQFFNNSNKVLVIDGTHMHSKWDGIMLCIVGVDAEGSNLTLGIALVPQENMVYWQLFFYAMVSEFPNPSIIMSDKAKGLESLRRAIIMANQSHIIEVEGNNTGVRTSTDGTVFALCAIHAMRNAKMLHKDSYSSITALAKAATQEEFDKKLENLKTKVSPSCYDYIVKHHEEFSYIGLQKTQQLKTNFGQVTNNPVEQTNFHLMECRKSPVIDMLQSLLKHLGTTYTLKALKAKEYKDVHCLSVCPAISKITLELGTSMRNAGWVNSISSIISNEEDEEGNTIVNVIFSVVLEKRTLISGIERKSYSVQLINNNQSIWNNNIICKCGWTMSTGRPCKHAAFCLCFPRTTDINKQDYVLGQFRYDMKRFYSTVYHVDTMIKQYSSVIRGPTFNSLIRYKIFPPFILKRCGRKKNRRKTKAANCFCKACGQTGHSVVSCTAKNSAQILINYNLYDKLVELVTPTKELIDLLNPSFSMSLEMSSILSTINLETQSQFDEDLSDEDKDLDNAEKQQGTTTSANSTNVLSYLETNNASLLVPQQSSYFVESIEDVQENMYTYAWHDYQLQQQYRNSSACTATSSNDLLLAPKMYVNDGENQEPKTKATEFNELPEATTDSRIVLNTTTEGDVEEITKQQVFLKYRLNS